jgi:tetratricopeptide (TPR) repeat protein
MSDKEDRTADRRLTILIYILAFLFVVLGASFIGYYSYTKYVQQQLTPEQKDINTAMKAIRDNPRDVGARNRLGVLYIQAGRLDDAIEQFNQALKVTRDDQESLLYAGIAYMNKEDYDNALTYFEREIKYYKNTAMAQANPSLEQAYYYSGVAYWKKKDYDKAIDYLNKALAIKKSNSDTYLVLGRVYLAKKSYDEALTAFSSALKFDPRYPDALYGLGLAYEGKGDKAKALEMFKEAVKAKSDFSEAQNAVQRLEAELKPKT